MKKALLFFLIFFISFPLNMARFSRQGATWSHIPSKSLAGLHYIFKGFDHDALEGVYKVTGPVVQIVGGDSINLKVFHDGFTTEVDEEEFEKEQELAASIFEATSGDGRSLGTAFLVGKDVVMTNRHVLSLKAKSKKWECGHFQVKLNQSEEKMSCEVVEYCSRRFDFCLVRLKDSETLSRLKPLRLSQKIRYDADHTFLHIGNAGGLGLQASRGFGIKSYQGEFIHFAPTLIGSSGAPIFSEKYEVVGINWGRTGQNYADDSSYSRGVLMLAIYQEIKQAKPKLLRDVRSFKLWHKKHQSSISIAIKERVVE